MNISVGQWLHTIDVLEGATSLELVQKFTDYVLYFRRQEGMTNFKKILGKIMKKMLTFETQM